MPDQAPSAFMVDANSDPIAVAVHGRASFQNSSSLHDFIHAMIDQGKTRFVIDFQNCTSMDSTFLGVLAGAAIALRKLPMPGSLVLCRLNPRNLELVQNLGLHRLLTVDTGAKIMEQFSPSSSLSTGPKLDELASARLVLAAHENLVEADASNQAKFQDVLTFLKGRVEQG